MKAQFIRKVISDQILKSVLKTNELPDFPDDIEVGAIDIGYGYTKYTNGVDDDGNVKCDLFPSITPLSPQESLSGDFFVSRDTLKIEHGGTTWEVGPDVHEIITQNDVRALHDNFVNSEQWKVLFLGALAYMDKPVIDLLVLGLPVSNMSKRSEMEELAVGEHTVGDKTFTVKNVFVVPQPLGTLYNYAIKTENFERFSKTNTLIVDPGFLTFDFLVTKGFAVKEHRSGARPGGMKAVLDAITKSISKELGTEYDDVNEIDQALDLKNYGGVQKSQPVYIYGKEIDLTPHKRQTKSVIDTSMNFMLNKIGDDKDIAQIIMAGGPNKIFERSIALQFPNHEVTSLPDGIFSNVMGFQLWGMMVAYGNAMKANKTKSPEKTTAA